LAASWRVPACLALLLLLLHVLQLLHQGLSCWARHASQGAQQSIKHTTTTTSNSCCCCRHCC
jgi:hypothetical protein